MSGSGLDEWNSSDSAFLQPIPRDAVRLLRKPFSSRELLTSVSELIGPPAGLPVPPERSAERRRVITTLERQAGLLELAHDAILVREMQGRIRYWNRAAEVLYGWSRDEALGRLTHDLLRTRFPVPFAEIEQALLTQHRWEGELRHTTRKGDEVIVSSRWAVRDARDAKVEILEINRDITAQKSAEEQSRQAHRELELRVSELAQAEAMFRGLLESAPDAMVIMGPDGKIALVNAQTEIQFGYSRDELIGQPVELLVPDRFRGRHPGHRSKYAQAPHVRPMGQGLDLYGKRKNGDEFPVEICLSPLKTEQGTLISSSIRDISERKQFEIKLQEKNLQLQRADQAKDMFLASMSHELRSPLHTIIGFADLLDEELKGPLNNDQKRFIHHISADSNHLLALINDILDLSKIEAGGLVLRYESFDLAAAIEEVISSIQPQLDAKSLRLETNLAPQLFLQADRLRFKQVLFNLLSNALKFTPDLGIIAITARLDAGFVIIAVRDSGIGIAKEEQEAVFDKFHQVGATTKGTREGTGLGLPITRALVGHHGGKIWVESEPGHGSTFTCRFPAERPSL
jgi:PAS domain S-box-containing protein